MKALAAILSYEQNTPEEAPVHPHPQREDRGDAVISAAMLVATAFRLRDESSLVFALRRLADAVALFEDEHLPA